MNEDGSGAGDQPVSREGVPAAIGEARALGRGLLLLWRSAPVAAVAFLVVSFVQGIGPNVAIVATGRLVGLAPRLAESPLARHQAVGAVLLLGGALVLTQALVALPIVLQGYVGYRYQAAFDSVRMAAVASLPGLEHFESPAMADRLLASSWGASAPQRAVGYLTSSVRWLVAATGSLVIVAVLGWWAPLVLVAPSVPSVVNNWRHAGRRAEHRGASSAQLRRAGHHRELALGIGPAREVRLFGLGDFLMDRQRRLWEEAVAPVFADLRHQLTEGLVISALKGVALGFVLVVALARFAAGHLSAGALTAVALALANLGASLRLLDEYLGQLHETTSFLPEAFAIVDLAHRDPRLDISGRASPAPAPVEGIAFEGVTFAYLGGRAPVLDGVDLFLPAGSSLALVGENGSGKSTLVKLLCRFYDPTEGRITLDGVDLREFDLAELRRRLAVVFQDFLRLPASIADNVGIGCVERAGDFELCQAAAAAAGADEVVDRLGQGWDTILAPEFGGVDLSGGEWQRVALARALAARRGRGAAVLVLDEPTAALDVRLEADLYRRFAELTVGATTLLISHRFSTVRMAHRVAVLEHGRIAEEGSHAELVEAGAGYARLYSLQARRFTERGDLE